MPTTVLTSHHSTPSAPPVPHLPLDPSPFSPGARPRTVSVDSLLREAPSQRAGVAESTDAIMGEPSPGIFMGLRIALLFNAGLGIAGFLAYEAWMMLAR